jgi:hypothetical protein
MTAAEAAKLGDGAIVVSRHTIPPWKPLTVKQVWVSADHTIARLLIKGEKSWQNRWIEADGLQHQPAGHEWDAMRMRWVRIVAGVVVTWKPPAPKPMFED